MTIAWCRKNGLSIIEEKSLDQSIKSVSCRSAKQSDQQRAGNCRDEPIRIDRLQQDIEEEKKEIVVVADAIMQLPLVTEKLPCVTADPKNILSKVERYENLLGIDSCSDETRNFLIQHGILQSINHGKQHFVETKRANQKQSQIEELDIKQISLAHQAA